MKGVVFFAHLCFALLIMYNGASTSVHHHSTDYASIQHIEKSQQPKLLNETGNYALVEDNILNKEDELFIAEEVEDDDVNDVLSKKNKLSSRSHLSLFNPFALTFYHRGKASQPFNSLLSDKHITLRVLRI